MLVAPAIVGSPAATAATRKARHSPSCGDATGSRWHIKHYFFRYDRHGAVVPADTSRLPASGDRYVVNAGGADCTLAHKSMHRLTSAIPDRALTGGKVGQFFVPPAPRRSTRRTRHSSGATIAPFGYCASLNHRGSFS